MLTEERYNIILELLREKRSVTVAEIKDKLGIHARPGLLLVQEAGKLTSDITIFKGTKSGDAKHMFCVMNLAAKQGDQIMVQVEGDNEVADAEVMRNFLEDNL